jgi:hypothetical protein
MTMLKYKIDKTLDVIFVQPEGDFRLEQILMHIDELAVDSDFRLGVNALYDFTAAEHVEGDLEALMAVAGRMEDQRIISKGSRVSIVVNNENMYRIFQGYCLMASSSLVKYQLFWLADMPQALDFIECERMPAID